VTWLVVGPNGRTRPRFERDEWLPLLRESWPVALALVVNVLYVRVLVIMISLLGTGEETGLFAASYLIVEIFVGVPALMLGTAFPVLAHAGAADQERLAYALQRLGEVALLIAVGIALVLMVGAKPIMQILGGSQYDDATPVLRIQAWALVGAFMTQGWVLGLVAIRRQRALIVTNAIALVVVLVLGFALIPGGAERGAAIAAVIGEAVLAVATFTMLVRARPDLRPNLGYVPRVALAAAAAVAVGLLVPLPDLVAAALAGVVYIAIALAVRAVPAEVFQALLRREEVA
jgi:O-antigen/teichoic acid export membrane protein